jgi:DNA-binding transcriptional LysR family regulator
MDLKEARYILTIAHCQSISKAANELFISQPSLSKYLKNLENQLGVKLFDHINNKYIPTYIGERYIHYAEKIMYYGNEWENEFDNLVQKNSGRINISLPIMLSTYLLQSTLSEFYSKYPYVKVNIMEEIHFVAEHSLQDPSIDLILYNVREFPKLFDYKILGQEELVMIVSKSNPLSRLGVKKEGFRYPWVDLKLFADENFILLYPDQNTGNAALKLFEENNIHPNVLLRTRNSEMSIRLSIEGVGIAFAPESYYHHIKKSSQSVCFSVGNAPYDLSLIAAYRKNRYMPEYVNFYISLIEQYYQKSKQ